MICSNNKTSGGGFINNLWEVVQIAAFIFSAQVGSGFFLLPSLLSTGGNLSFLVFSVVGILAMVTIHIFAQTGLGVRQIIEKSFGNCSKYIYFIYWFISWFSTIVLFKELVGYCGLVGMQATTVELLVWLMATGLNLWKLQYTIYIESLLTVIKILPFVFLVVGYFLSPENNGVIVTLEPVNMGLFLRCMWCFVGIETGNIIASNLKITPRNKKIGTYTGMSIVIFFYLISVFLSFRMVGNKALVDNMAPYLTIFKFAYSKFLSPASIANGLQLLIVLTLVGSINSWTISSGYAAKECGENNILPKWCKTKNRHQVPYIGILLSSLLVLVFLLLCNSSNIYRLTVNAIDISCCFFLLIYGICLLAYGKTYTKNKYNKIFYLIVSTIFIGAFFMEIIRYINVLR